MSTVIDLDQDTREQTVTLPDFGDVQVHPLRGRGAWSVTSHATRRSPLLVADQLIAQSTGLRASEARGLTQADRHQLILAVVRANEWLEDWQALYGSFLSADERLVACGVWGTSVRRQLRLARLIASRNARFSASRPELKATLGMSATAPYEPFTAVSQLAKLTDPWRKLQMATAPLAAFEKQSRMMRSFADPGFSARAIGGLSAVNVSALGMRVNEPKIKLPAVLDTQMTGVVGVRGFMADTGVKQLMRSSQLPRELGALAGHGMIPEQARWIVRSKQTAPLIGLGFDKSVLGFAGAPSWLKSLESIVRPLSAFSAPGLQELLKPNSDLAAAGIFWDTWANEPLGFLISRLGFSASRELFYLDPKETLIAVLAALEMVVRDEQFIGAMRQLIRETVQLPEAARDHLDHALEHAQEGEWRRAVAPFHPGYEGVLSFLAHHRQLVHPTEPFRAAEALLKRVITDEEHQMFVIRFVLGGTGNEHRHGRANDGEREVVLSGVVALAALLDELLGVNAMDTLISRMHRYLPTAVAASESRVLEAVSV